MSRKAGRFLLIFILIFGALVILDQVGCAPKTPVTTRTPVNPATPGNTVTPVITPTPVDTSPPTPSNAVTPSSIVTPINTPTPTKTLTLTISLTPTNTPTRVNTITPSGTATPGAPISTGNVIEFPSHTIVKNFWGASSNETLTGDIFLNSDYSFGWSWDRENPQMIPGVKGVLPIYPYVRIGADFGQKSNNQMFPLKASDIDSLKFYLNYSYPSEPTGEYNFSYQMYFSDVPNPPLDAKPLAEVMIWIHATFGQPPYTYQGDYSDNNHNYSLYSWTMSDGRKYFSFIMKGKPVFAAQHFVDAKQLLNDISISPNWYLLGVHLGNEVLIGSGKVQIQQLNIVLNGKVI